MLRPRDIRRNSKSFASVSLMWYCNWCAMGKSERREGEEGRGSEVEQGRGICMFLSPPWRNLRWLCVPTLCCHYAAYYVALIMDAVNKQRRVASVASWERGSTKTLLLPCSLTLFFSFFNFPSTFSLVSLSFSVSIVVNRQSYIFLILFLMCDTAACVEIGNRRLPEDIPTPTRRQDWKLLLVTFAAIIVTEENQKLNTVLLSYESYTLNHSRWRIVRLYIQCMYFDRNAEPTVVIENIILVHYTFSWRNERFYWNSFFVSKLFIVNFS